MLKMWNNFTITCQMGVTKHQEMMLSFSYGILMQKLGKNAQLKEGQADTPYMISQMRMEKN
jgi:hypothetical protein